MHTTASTLPGEGDSGEGRRSGARKKERGEKEEPCQVLFLRDFYFCIDEIMLHVCIHRTKKRDNSIVIVMYIALTGAPYADDDCHIIQNHNHTAVLVLIILVFVFPNTTINNNI